MSWARLDATNYVAGLMRILEVRGAIASVALSHPGACRCDVCKASRGDNDALARVMVEMEERR